MAQIQWSAPEYHEYEKHPLWHIGVGVASLIIIVISLFQKNFLFAIFIAIAGYLVISWGKRPPGMAEFLLTEKEFTINNRRVYPYEKIIGFDIIEPRGQKAELIIKSSQLLRGAVHAILPKERKDEVELFLTKRLPKIEYEESMTEHIGRLFKF
jgi:hypothetical protein